MTRLVIGSAFLILGACSSDSPPAATSAEEALEAAEQRARPADGIPWPDPPANGSPVVAEFLTLVTDDGDLRAEMRFFNQGDKDVDLVEMELRYLDEGGEELKRFPWKAAPSLSSRSHVSYVVGAFLPEETKRVEADISGVRYADGTRWSTKPPTGD